MADVVLVTGRDMPHGPAEENPLLVDALAARGIAATVEPWGSDASTNARLVVVRTTWDYTSHLDSFLAWLDAAGAATGVVNPPSMIRWNSHKSYLLDLAYAAVPVLPTALVARGSSGAEVAAALEEYDGEVVIKPAVSVGAIGTILVGASDPRASAHLGDLVAGGDALVQPFEPSISSGEVSLIYFGGEYSHAVRKTPAAGDFRVQVFHGGVNTAHLASDEELAVGAIALTAVDGDPTYARVDLVATERGPVLMELELIEPQLFLEVDGAADRFAAELGARLG
jgi:glutathione synthase/RimK-type ligase-like ATP-grasp enzyme